MNNITNGSFTSVANLAASMRTSEMQRLIKEFRGLYKEKLARLEETGVADTEEIMKVNKSLT